MTDARNDLSVEDLPEDLEYNPFTGVFKRGKRTFERTCNSGYIRFRIKDRLYLAHRVAWLLCYGHWPKGQIDHFNGMRTDNRLANLRDVPQQLNQQNMNRATARSRSGLLGVATDRGRWTAEIRVNRKRTNLGYYATKEEAHQAYMEVKRKFHPTSLLAVTYEQSKGRIA